MKRPAKASGAGAIGRKHFLNGYEHWPGAMIRRQYFAPFAEGQDERVNRPAKASGAGAIGRRRFAFPFGTAKAVPS